MAVDRPTFSESWYRVADLKPRLRSIVQTFRQHYRGHMWHVLRDPSNNQFFRLNEPAYHFVALLDGKRTVAEVWDICNEHLGDAAPTQNEAIQVLGQLYTSNLLTADMPADTTGMFDRYKKRIQREVQQYVTNLLFIRIPLFDPDKILDRWVGIFGRAFTWYGALIWAAMLLTGIWQLVGHTQELVHRAGNILAPENMIWLGVAFWVIKILHEFGHGFACKKFGRDSHSGGEVHTMGIMFLVLMPVPYVDTSSSWVLRSKWKRAMVGAGGMYVELFIASIMALVWVHTLNATDGVAHFWNVIAYNAMFIASVSSLIFNGNPLLRFDAYYILSDLLELPNLQQRSKDYIYYLVKKYIYGVRTARTTTQGLQEKFWMAFYGVASFIYRILISVSILLFVSRALLGAGIVLAAVSIFMWGVIPLCKYVNYLATNPELLRTRQRSVVATVVVIAAVVVLFGFVDMPDHGRAQGVVQAVDRTAVYMGADGFIEETPTELLDTYVSKDNGPVLLVARNRELELELRRLEAERLEIQARRRMAAVEEVSLAQSLERRLESLDRQIAQISKQLKALEVRPPISGRWVAPDLEKMRGAYVRRGQKVGMILTDQDVQVLVAVGQSLAPRLAAEYNRGEPIKVDIRVRKNPEIDYAGRITKFPAAGEEKFISQAMSIMAGGNMAPDPDDREGKTAAERFFRVEVQPLPYEGKDTPPPPLRDGQRVICRFELSPKPWGVQIWRVIRLTVQKLFNM